MHPEDNIAALEAQIGALSAQLNEERHARKLAEQERDSARQALAYMENSRRWQLATKFMGLLRKFIPAGSHRDAILRRLLGFLRRSSAAQPDKVSTPIPLPEIVPIRTGSLTAADYPVVPVAQWDEPTVSIVIPCYNQFEYTYHCVQSVIAHSGDITYEILIADDCSTDLTETITDILPGVRHIRNEKNLRFLLNCNHAVTFAKGKYVLFLNNDTQVQPNWLAPLVTLIASDPTIGMVGSKLIYPDGTLQEAGGIIWQDGSAWNYGNRQNPALPEFNYVKDADYISGAAIMLPRALWEDIGGFDPRFCPAYCEDSDLAFAVRDKGYRVVYQPRSVVVHFEGITNGTDTSSGQKQYQVTNRETLFEKWKHVMASHKENAQDVFLARDHSFGKKTVLFIDHYVPTYDRDAGSRTVFQYLKLFVRHGYNVKFIGDDFKSAQPYTSTLQQLGIEVLYGPEYEQGWENWLRDNGKYINYVFVNRPHIAPKYMDALRAHTNARIMYYGHDLAFLRTRREAEVTGDPARLAEADDWQAKELAIMRQADMTYYPSYVEIDVIHAIDPTIPAKAIPAYLFEDVDPADYRFHTRKDLMFVGGFIHRPNVDAAKWIAEEILPELVQLVPDIKVHVIGSHPTEELKALESEHFLLEGFVSDEELERFYRTCRLSIVPLRYGAGIKGKVIEALRYGTPVVTTSVGAEGIAGAETVMVVEDDPKQLARRIAEVYNNESALTDLSRKGTEYIQKNYSYENAVAVIAPDFDL